MLTANLDPYIAGLAALATPCFGYHEQGNPTCGDCPISIACKGRWGMLAAEMAAQIEAAEAAKAAKAIGVPASAPTGLSFDDLLAETTTATTTAADAADPFGDLLRDIDETKGKGRPTKPKAKAAPTPPPAPAGGRPATAMKAVVDSICASCGGRIPAGTMATYKPGTGLVHDGCP